MELLTERQQDFIRNLPYGCTFYTADSLRTLSRTVRVQLPDRRSSYVLHVEYDKDDEFASEYHRKYQAVVDLYKSGAAERQRQVEEEFVAPF